MCQPASPAFELPRQGGAHVLFDERQRLFVVQAAPDGRTAQAELFVAGEITGTMNAAAAAAAGCHAGEALAAELLGG